MADQYTEVKHTSFLQNMLNSVIGILLGIVLFLAAFPVLWFNEGRTNLATVARESTPIEAGSVQSVAEGKLVAATGTLSSPETLGDTSFLKPGKYLALERKVEMYAWVEKESRTTKKNAGGSSTTETTYRYEQEWTSNPKSASSFKYSSGHENPKLPVEHEEWTVSAATLGAYTVQPKELLLPDAETLKLDDQVVTPTGTWKRDGDYLVNNSTALKSPKVGDVRISYAVVRADVPVTLFGKASGNQIVAYETDNAHLYRAFVENREGAIELLNTEYTLSLWIIRLIGFMMMWIGLSICFGPVNAMLDILPFLGRAGRFLIGAAMLVVSLMLSIVTILLSIIAHNILLLLALLALIVGGGVLWSRLRKPKMTAIPA